jgi:hypothetical protein
LELLRRSHNPTFNKLQFRGNQSPHFFHRRFELRNVSDGLGTIRMLSNKIVFASNGAEKVGEMCRVACTRCEENYRT